MDKTTFEYLKPTEAQLSAMADIRQRFSVLEQALSAGLPEGPDKTYLMRKLREVAM